MLKRAFSLLLGAQVLLCATLRKVELTEGPNYARVIFTLSSRVKFKTGRIKYGEKTLLYVDFYGTYPGRIKSRYYFENPKITLIRVSKKDRRRLRAVLYLKDLLKYRVFFLPSPPRVVVDIFFQGKEIPLLKQLGLKIRKIAIDPGHGGKDSGCVNQKLHLKEKHIVLDIAFILKSLLENDGYQVVMTREGDSFLPLERRTAIANGQGADLFISLHINSSRNPRVKGIESFYLNLAADPEAERVAAKENETSGKTLSQLGDILKKIVLNEKIRQSKAMAITLQKVLIRELRRFYPDVRDLGARGAPFFVLMGAEMPAVLVEISFLSNPEEARRLRDPLYRARVAYALYLGLKEFIKEVEGK